MKIIKLLTSNFSDEFKINKILEILGFAEEGLALETKSFLVDKILDYIFNFKENKTTNNEKIFDFFLDYKYYYYDFYKLGIDLNKDDIDWWQFNTLLEGILLQKEGAMLQVLEYRTYEKPTENPKVYQNKIHQYYLRKKREFALPQEQEEVDGGFKKMWEYLKQQNVTNNHERS